MFITASPVVPIHQREDAVRLRLDDQSIIQIGRRTRGLYQISFDEDYDLTPLRKATVQSLNDRRSDHTDARMLLGIPYGTVVTLAQIESTTRIIYVSRCRKVDPIHIGSVIQVKYVAISQDGGYYSHAYPLKDISLHITEIIT